MSHCLNIISTATIKEQLHIWVTLSFSGFGGLVVSMLASGTQVRGFKAVCPVSQICGTLKNPCDYMEVGSQG
jgi:hypothetical protein